MSDHTTKPSVAEMEEEFREKLRMPPPDVWSESWALAGIRQITPTAFQARLGRFGRDGNQEYFMTEIGSTVDELFDLAVQEIRRRARAN